MGLQNVTFWLLLTKLGELSNCFLLCNKKSRFDFADELKIGDVRYKHYDLNNN